MTALSYVSVATGNSDSNGTTAATGAWSLTTGNHVFVYVRWEVNSGPTITLSDTAGNTYTALTQVWASQVGGQWFYCLNATGNASNVVTATFSSAAAYKAVRAITLSGSTPTVALATASGVSVNSVTISSTITDGAGAMMLAGESSYNGDGSSFNFSGVGTWTNVGTSYQYAATSYLARPSGDFNTPGPTYTGGGNSLARVLMVLTLDVGGAVPATDSAFSKMTGYAVIGGATDSASLSKVAGYAILGGPDDRATVAKLGAYAVLGGLSDSMTVSKLIAYAVLTPAGTSRPQCFAAT